MKSRLRVGIAVESWNRGWKLESRVKVGITVGSWNRGWKSWNRSWALKVESRLKVQSQLSAEKLNRGWKLQSQLSVEKWIAVEKLNRFWKLNVAITVENFPCKFWKARVKPTIPLGHRKATLDTWAWHLTFPGAIADCATASWLINGDVRLQLWQNRLRVLYYGLFSHQEYSANKLLDGLVTNYIYNRLQDKSYLHICNFSLVPRFLPVPKSGERAWTIWSRASWCTMCGFDNRIIARAVRTQ